MPERVLVEPIPFSSLPKLLVMPPLGGPEMLLLLLPLPKFRAKSETLVLRRLLLSRSAVWCVTTTLFCALYREVGLKGYAE